MSRNYKTTVEVTRINPLSRGWDGKSNGIELPSDDYWFVIHFDNGKIEKGHFSLKR